METIHVDKQGVQYKIAEMTDDHLKNTINAMLNNAKVLGEFLKQDIDKVSIMDIVHGVNRKQLRANAEKKIKAIYGKLSPYIMEAVFRGMDFGQELRIAFDRQETGPVKPLLPMTLSIEDLFEG